MTVPSPRYSPGELAGELREGQVYATLQRFAALATVSPAVRVMQAGQGRSSQRIERSPTIGAPVTRLVIGVAPGTDILPTAVRTAELRNPFTAKFRQEGFALAAISGRNG